MATEAMQVEVPILLHVEGLVKPPPRLAMHTTERKGTATGLVLCGNSACIGSETMANQPNQPNQNQNQNPNQNQKQNQDQNRNRDREQDIEGQEQQNRKGQGDQKRDDQDQSGRRQDPNQGGKQ